jgi:hypothetical protein
MMIGVSISVCAPFSVLDAFSFPEPPFVGDLDGGNAFTTTFTKDVDGGDAFTDIFEHDHEGGSAST